MTLDLSRAKFVRTTGVVVPFATKPVGDLPALTGTVRPCSAAERGKFLDDEYPQMKAAHGHDGALARLYARHIVSWDFFDSAAHDQPLPITPENVASLPPPVFDQIAGIVQGTGLGNGSAGG